MGTKRPIDSGRVDKNGKKIMVSEKSTQNTDMKKSAIQGGAVPIVKEVFERDQYVDDIIIYSENFADHKDELIALGVDPKVFSDEFEVRQQAAWSGKDLDILIHDEHEDVRIIVADQGYGLETLINDEDEYVRAAVAGQGYSLGILINDDYEVVRAAVADQGYDLETLINDESEYVREIAKKLI